MMGRRKKTKEWKKRQKKIKERQRTRDAIIASQEELLERVKATSIQGGAEIRVERSTLKMSEVIIDFAAPLLDVAQTNDEQRKAIAIAITIWNLAMTPEKTQKEFLEAMNKHMRTSTLDQETSEEDDRGVIYMLERKKMFFPQIKRMILDYECLETPKGLHLNIVSNVHEDR